MSYASPVFKAMLSNRFKEGNQLASASTVEIPLPDDNAEDMQIICNVIHMRHDTVPHILGDIKTLALAELCDKYACATAVRPSIEAWVHRMMRSLPKGSLHDEDRGRYLTIACLLDYQNLLRDVGIDFVMNSTSSLTQVSTLGAAVPRNVICKRPYFLSTDETDGPAGKLTDDSCA